MLDGQNYVEAVENIRAILGAVAFEMYAQPEKLDRSNDENSPESGTLPVVQWALRLARRQQSKTLEPFTRAIPPMPARIYRDFKDAVADRLIAAKALTLKNLNIDDELNLLGKMNVGAVDFLLFGKLGPEGLRWHDRTVQAFFAAHWAMKYGSDDDIQRLQQWVTDKRWDCRWPAGNNFDERLKVLEKDLLFDGRLVAFDEFWQFAAEMPDELIDGPRWLRVFGPCYTPPAHLTGSHNWVQWNRRMVYHSFDTMQNRAPEAITKWRVKTLAQAAVVSEIEAGWREIAAGVCHYGAEPSLGRRGREIQVPGFRMHQWPVINRWYESFDPTHRMNRWGANKHPLASLPGREGEDNCPAVCVTWYDAWNFAAWIGDHVFLPSELEWEHACRKGTAWDYFFEGSEAELVEHAWFFRNSGGHTHPLPMAGSHNHQNANGLYDMLGNVSEWCAQLQHPDIWHLFARGLLPNALYNIRGASWSGGTGRCTIADRDFTDPSRSTNYIGFRLASVPVKPTQTT